MASLNKIKLCLYVTALMLLVVLAFSPFDLQMAPLRHFQIMDVQGHPLGGAIVRQVWYQYSLGEQGEVELKTDTEGDVSLPARAIRTSIFSLLKGAMREIREVGIHGASFLSDETITIIADGFPAHIYFSGKGLKIGKVIIRKGPLDKTIIGSD